MPKIFVLSGPDVGMSAEVQAGAKLGRAPDCALSLRHASVSRHHAQIELDGGVWWIVDLDSRNGLLVGGERVPRAALEDGAEFHLGEVLMRFRVPVAEAGGTTPAASAPAASEPRVRPVEKVPAAHADEIELEGDWDPMATPAQATMPTAQSAGTFGQPTMPSAPVVREESARERATAKLTAAGAMPKGQAGGGRGVLQFNKVEARSGFVTSELGQQPWWVQAGVWILALVVFAVLLWVAFRGTLWMRGAGQEQPVIEENAGDSR